MHTRQFDTGDDDMQMPEIYQKWQDRARTAVRSVRVVPSRPVTVDEHEAGFRRYWMIAAWVILAYMGITMGVIVVNMLQANVVAHPYPWFAHLVGTSIIMGMMTITALVFRFVIFPLPGVIVQFDDVDDSRAVAGTGGTGIAAVEPYYGGGNDPHYGGGGGTATADGKVGPNGHADRAAA